MNKEEIIEQLKTGIYRVTFTKVNGEERSMPCTLQDGQVPVFESKGTKTVNDNVVSAWCTDKQAWRSFRVDSVKSIDQIYIADITEDPENGEYLLTLPDDLIEKTGWEIGDVLKWSVDPVTQLVSVKKES